MRTVPKLFLAMILFILTASSAYAEYKLVWSDEFEGPGIDKQIWNHEVYPGVVNRSSLIHYYTARPANSFIENGNLVIQVCKEKYHDYEYTSARLNTYGKFDFLYGKVEARLKLPSANGLSSKLWLLPADLRYGGWAASGEIDVVEAVNAKPTQITGRILFGGAGPRSEHKAKDYRIGYGEQAVDFSQDFHIYSLEWQPYEMRWYVDGNLYAIQNHWTSIGGPYPAPFDRPFYLVAGVAADSLLSDSIGEGTTWPQKMYIDWIRLYQTKANKPPTVKLTSPADKAKFAGGAKVVIQAEASDPDGKIEKVEFYSSDELLGSDAELPYRFVWPAPDGCHLIIARAVDDGGYVAADSVEIEQGIGCPPLPFHGRPSAIPGRIEAEDFDASKKGESYFDRDPTNNGGAYRLDTGVDIQACSEGGFNVGWMEDNEWMQYTVEVAAAGAYDITARVGSPRDSARFHIEFDGVDKTGMLTVPNTGDWQNYTDVKAAGVELSAGRQVMRIFVDINGFNLHYVEITLAKEK